MCIRDSINAEYMGIILIGESGVGKTALFQKIFFDKFQADSKTTIMTDLGSKEINVNGIENSLEIWDTAGQERYQCMCKNFYREAEACIMVYDITSQSSFDLLNDCLLYTSPSPRDLSTSRMPSSA
eukprot:TRINITY_DN12011_c0_g1_i1.p1 TRINITY_DN12011_c0_g1~~TRINITY_DN12011_c0_g1_i1.p1  ORF type:complete len:126 (+),score=29.91 TRINITY_DN12011_c0_g1_i1:166-543(+)